MVAALWVSAAHRLLQICSEHLPERCVPLKALWFATLLLTALGMTMGAAHVLELPAKLSRSRSSRRCPLCTDELAILL